MAHAIFLPVPRFRILDGLEIALSQSETLLHCRHVRIRVLIFTLIFITYQFYLFFYVFEDGICYLFIQDLH